MYWRASATLWTRSSCLIVVMNGIEVGSASGRGDSIIAPASGCASPLENQQQIREEQQQMHRAEQDVGAPAREGERAENEREREQDDVLNLQSQHDVFLREQPDGEHRGNRRADGREHRAEQKIDRALQLVRERGADGARRLG